MLQAQADEGEEGVEEAQAGLSLQHGITTASEPSRTQPSSQSPSEVHTPMLAGNPSGVPHVHHRSRLGTLSTRSPTQDQRKATRTWPFSTFVLSLLNTRREDLLRQR